MVNIGSFYLLVLMAAAEIRPKMRLWTGDICPRLCRLIRHPVLNGVFKNDIQFITNNIIRKRFK